MKTYEVLPYKPFIYKELSAKVTVVTDKCPFLELFENNLLNIEYLINLININNKKYINIGSLSVTKRYLTQ